MPSVTALGISSGLDIASLVTQLVAAERAPTQSRLDIREAGTLSKLSALGSIKGALAAFQNTLEPLTELGSFQGRTATSTNSEVFTATASADAIAGRYSIEVTSLASAHKLRSSAYATADMAVGTGTLTLSAAGETFAVAIDSPNNTLIEIASAINEAPGNTQILATIINSVDGAHLVLTSAATGASSSITVLASGGDGGLDNLIYDPVGGTTNLAEVTVAADANLLIDSLQVTSSSNVVSDAITGLTIDILSAEPGTAYELTIGYDADAARSNVLAFVQSYNSLVQTLSVQTKFDTETLRGGPLLGDSAVRALVSELRIAVSGILDGASGSFRALVDIGITTELDGTLVIDETILDAVLDEDFDEVGRLFSGANGFATTLDTKVAAFLEPSGRLETRTDVLKLLIDDLADRREALDRRMVAVESRLLAQFIALDSLIGQLDSTSTFLGQQLANLPGYTFERN